MKTAVNIALILGFAGLVPILGLFTTTCGYLVVHMLFLGVRPLVLVLGVSAGATAVMYGFFGYLLGVEMNGAWFI